MLVRMNRNHRAQITDVYPDGRSMLITQGIQRMRWRLSNSVPAPMVPGTVYQIDIDLWETSYIFEAGHRVRLSVSSSNYPRFSANKNNGLLLVDEDKLPAVIATNRIHLTNNFQSRLVLPIVPLSAVPANYQIRPRFDRPEFAELSRFLDMEFADVQF